MQGTRNCGRRHTLLRKGRETSKLITFYHTSQVFCGDIYATDKTKARAGRCYPLSFPPQQAHFWVGQAPEGLLKGVVRSCDGAPCGERGFQVARAFSGFAFPKKWREATYLILTPARKASYPWPADQIPLNLGAP
jgi:hypothetical protein